MLHSTYSSSSYPMAASAPVAAAKTTTATSTPFSPLYLVTAMPSTTQSKVLFNPYQQPPFVELKPSQIQLSMFNKPSSSLYSAKLLPFHAGVSTPTISTLSNSYSSPTSSTLSDMSYSSASIYPNDTLLTQSFVPSPTETVVSFEFFAPPSFPMDSSAEAGIVTVTPPSVAQQQVETCQPHSQPHPTYHPYQQQQQQQQQRQLDVFSLSSLSPSPVLGNSSPSSTSTFTSLCSTPSGSPKRTMSIHSFHHSLKKKHDTSKSFSVTTNNSYNNNNNKKVQKPKPFGCPICHRPFARKHDLQRHIRVHTGDKPYACLCCKKAFARTDALKRHLRVEEECQKSHEMQVHRFQQRQQQRLQLQQQQQQQQPSFFFNTHHLHPYHPRFYYGDSNTDRRDNSDGGKNTDHARYHPYPF